MAHKTLISGTAYEISGGKTLVGGTMFGIKGGKTSVNGTAYSIAFGAAVIEFKINNMGRQVTYQAEDGMTWAQWCASSYNTVGYSVSGSRIYDETKFQYIMGVTPAAVITDGGEYMVVMDF